MLSFVYLHLEHKRLRGLLMQTLVNSKHLGTNNVILFYIIVKSSQFDRSNEVALHFFLLGWSVCEPPTLYIPKTCFFFSFSP
mmetsp:Transcript_15957/g.45886  ORF Transcript_15957/g.45886 Transcript_15957/m.45886 type:complete len:82 (-) Transcript_15957:1689-1934(-)